MPGNPGFFTVFKSEGPKKLIINSVPVMGPIDLEGHTKIIWLGHLLCFPLSVSLGLTFLGGDQIFHWTTLWSPAHKLSPHCSTLVKRHEVLRRKSHYPVCRCSLDLPGFWGVFCHSTSALNFSLCPSIYRASLSSFQGANFQTTNRVREGRLRQRLGEEI